MNEDRAADNLPHPKPVGKETHFSQAVVGKEYREIPSVVAVGLLIRIPMVSHG